MKKENNTLEDIINSLQSQVEKSLPNKSMNNLIERVADLEKRLDALEWKVFEGEIDIA